MKRVPSSFQIGGHSFTVKRVSPAEMHKKAEGHECYGLFVPDELSIYILKAGRGLKQSVVMQTFYHEFAHAALWCMNHKDYANETVVDHLGHVLHQAFATATF